MTNLACIIEALLITAHEPLTAKQLLAAFPVGAEPSLEDVLQAIEALKHDYETRSFTIQETASGFSLQTKACYAPWISQLHAERPAKYSKALLETLAVIAYRQPVTRADIEALRGVTVNSHIMKTLLEREWIRVSGYRDVPGKPALYVTTKLFLDYFNLKNLNELPAVVCT